MVTEEETARLGQVVMHDIPDAVVYADRTGVIGFWNAGATRIFGILVRRYEGDVPAAQPDRASVS